MKELISIIIPTFNRAFSLNKSIESVQAQTCEKWELIVIDDGSDDETPELVKKYLGDSRIKYFHQTHQGVSIARNSGARHAIGDYLIFLDSDDIFFPDLIKNVYEAEFYKYDLMCWQVLKIIDGEKSFWKPKKLSQMYKSIKASFLAGSICYRKDLFFKAGGYDPKITFGENYELGLRISQVQNLKIKIINKVFLKYEITTSTRASNSLDNRLSSYLYQYKKHKSNYDKNPKEKSEMNYLIGFVLEKLNRRSAALVHYKNSWLSNPLKIKPLLKIIYLKAF